MGYDVRLTRAPMWINSQDYPITLDEWKSYILSDPEMSLDNQAEVTTPKGEKISYENEGLVTWTAYSAGKSWFDFRNGCIVVSNPDDEIIRKMLVIAKALNARVQGDEGEYYD